MFKEIDFAGFDGREEKLQKIIRYNMERRTPMHYRTNDLIHSKRVHLLVNDILPTIAPIYNNGLNPSKALTLALVHDDAEILTGDVQLYYKDRMSLEQLTELKLKEKQAIEQLSKNWPEKIDNFSYKELLCHALYKNCLEAQVVSYCDKIDGFCEAVHEIYAGNQKFTGSAVAYVKKLNQFPEKFPLLNKIIPSNHPFLVLPKELNLENMPKETRFHTLETIKNLSGISHYDRWKELTIKYFGAALLLEVKEL